MKLRSCGSRTPTSETRTGGNKSLTSSHPWILRFRDQPVSDPDWVGWPDEKLLELRMCDLDLTIEGTEVEQRIAQVHAEIEARGLAFRPHYWLSDEWFTPDGVP